MFRNAWKFIKTIRVEPIIFLFCVTVSSYNAGTSSLTTQKICFPEGPPGIKVVCTDKERLKAIADVAQVKSIIRDCVPAFVVILAGAWRDVSGRSLPLLILPTVFEMLATVTEIVSYIYWDSSPMLMGALASCFGVIGGSSTTMSMVGLAHIAATSTHEQRAMRTPVLVVAMLGGMCIASFGSGFVLTWVDYEPYFIGILVLYGLTIFLAVVLVKDTRNPASDAASYCDTFRRLRVIFNKRPNAFNIWMFIVATTLITCMLGAEGSVNTLYLQGKFHLPPAQMGLFSGYKMLISLLAGAIAMPLLKQIFKISDFTIAYICVVPSVISCIGLAFSESLTQLYIFATLDLLRIVLITTLLHLFTGLLQKTEVGLFTSLLSFTEGILPLGLKPLYTFVYKSTIDTMPGAFFLVSAGSLLLSSILIGIISCTYKPIVPDGQEEEEENL